MTSEVIGSLKALLDEMEGLIGHDPDIETLADINARFHETIYKQANSPRLYSMIQSLWMSFPKSSLLFPLDRVHVSLREHKEIVDALSIGDVERAELLMRLHVDSVAEDEIEWVEHFGL
jgi:DNA-binding GntR family transcriptional regulator